MSVIKCRKDTLLWPHACVCPCQTERQDTTSCHEALKQWELMCVGGLMCFGGALQQRANEDKNHLFLTDSFSLARLLPQAGGRRDPSWDLPALHPAAVLPGDVHHRDAEVHVPAGGATAPQEKYGCSNRNNPFCY